MIILNQERKADHKANKTIEPLINTSILSYHYFLAHPSLGYHNKTHSRSGWMAKENHSEKRPGVTSTLPVCAQNLTNTHTHPRTRRNTPEHTFTYNASA
jgi:hypothetical protein